MLEPTGLADLSRQRDALVREVHHRIKNHLHGVMGLLRVQADAHADLAPHLIEVMGQVGAIAGVYGLQGTGAHSGADLGEVVRLIATVAAGPVDCEGLAATPLPLADVDAVPVALVVNELVANALKHREGPDPVRPVRRSRFFGQSDKLKPTG